MPLSKCNFSRNIPYFGAHIFPLCNRLPECVMDYIDALFFNKPLTNILHLNKYLFHRRLFAWQMSIRGIKRVNVPYLKVVISKDSLTSMYQGKIFPPISWVISYRNKGVYIYWDISFQWARGFQDIFYMRFWKRLVQNYSEFNEKSFYVLQP